MSFNKKFFTTGGIVASAPPAAAAFDPLQNFETVTYTGNGSTQKITGYIRKGAAFNGSSSQIDLNYASLGMGVNDFSYSFWFKLNSTSGNQTFFQVLSEHVNYGLRINSTYNLQSSPTNSSGGGQYIGSNVTLDTDWHHVAYIKSSTTGVGHALYYDGTKIAEDTSFTGDVQTATDNKTTLGSATNDINWFNGSLDQVRFFNKALDQDDVDDLYLETYADPKKSTTDYFGDGSGVALYELDDSADTTPYYPYGTGDIDAGQSAVFNGSSSYIDTNFTVPASSTFSISWWMNASTASITGNHYIFGDNDNQGNDVGFAVYNSNAGVGAYGYGFNTGEISTTYKGSWVHFAIVLDGSTFNFYQDGVSIDTRTITSRSSASSRSLIMGRFGAYAAGSQFHYDGSIDQVRIYSSALSASDVEALVSETNVPTANLVAHYKLDGNANDETTNYDGTWGGTEAYSDPAEFPNVAYNGTPTNVNFLGMAFQPDFVWIKNRVDVDMAHVLQDTVRGAGQSKTLASNNSSYEGQYGAYGYISSFDTNGFTAVDGLGNHTNTDGKDYVAWCWKAGGVPTPNNNTQGTITSTVSANQDAGFSIVKWTGNDLASQTIGHGLSSTPEITIIKKLTSALDWQINLNSSITGTEGYLNFNTVALYTTFPNYYTSANSTVLSTNGTTTAERQYNNQSADYIAYCFHSVDGYQKVGYFNQVSGTTTVSTGFEPRFLIIKRTDDTGDWTIFDNLRNNGDAALYANSSIQEQPTTGYTMAFNNDGFVLTVAAGSYDVDYIYLAIA